MIVYLSGQAPWKEEGLYDETIVKEKPYTLDSYYYIDSFNEKYLNTFKDFMMDSGAFTFMVKAGTKNIDWIDYTEKYGKYVRTHGIKKFYEMDIDPLVGYGKVKELRERLEFTAGAQCIPVRHKTRGTEEYIKMCEDYPYIALGGVVISGRNSDEKKRYERMFPWLIKTAHQNNAKIHALGYTSMEGLKKYHFDSVDSTAWTTGNRFGTFYKFTGNTMKTIKTPEGKRISIEGAKKVAQNNYIEWVKFQKWADTHL